MRRAYWDWTSVDERYYVWNWCWRALWVVHLIWCLCFYRYLELEVYIHDDVIKWNHFHRYWLFVRGIHRSPVNFPHKGQWRGALMFSLIYVWTNDWANHRYAGDLTRHRAHYDVTVMRIALLLWEEEPTGSNENKGLSTIREQNLWTTML